MAQAPPAAGAPDSDDLEAARCVDTIMLGLGHLARASPMSFESGLPAAAPSYGRVADFFQDAPVDLAWMDSLRRAGLEFRVRQPLPSSASGSGRGGHDGGDGGGDLDASLHPNANNAPHVRVHGGRSDATVLASAAHASHSRLHDLARPGVVLREGSLCEIDGCSEVAGVFCSATCCRETGMVLCFGHDLRFHSMSPSGKRCMLVRVTAVGGESLPPPAGSASSSPLASGVASASGGASASPLASGVALASGHVPVVIRPLRADEFVLEALPGVSFADEVAIVTRPLCAPEAAVCPSCGSALSRPLEWDVSAPFVRVDSSTSYRVGHVTRWACAFKSPAGVCGHVWARSAGVPQIVGASALTPKRTHTIIDNDVIATHVHQRAAASHGQPAEELYRVLGSIGAWLPLASVRRWLWAHTMWEVHVWGMLLGALHACIVCGSSPRAAFEDGCFSAWLRCKPLFRRSRKKSRTCRPSIFAASRAMAPQSFSHGHRRPSMTTSEPSL